MNTYAKDFADVKHLIGDFVVPFWQEINSRLGAEFSALLPQRFLLNNDICNTMYSRNKDWATQQLNWLKTLYTEKQLKWLIAEYDVGGGDIVFLEYNASCNSIHHLYNFSKYKEATGKSFASSHEIVEWGGGYGRYAVFMSRFQSFCNEFTNFGSYNIVDIPAFSCLQKHYLETVLGEGSVRLIKSPDDKLDKMGINLIPVGLAAHMGLNPDTFIAMWSLGESASSSLDFVTNKGWLDCDNVMMATHGNVCDFLPIGHKLLNSETQKPIKKVAFEYVRDHHFLFR